MMVKSHKPIRTQSWTIFLLMLMLFTVRKGVAEGAVPGCFYECRGLGPTWSNIQDDCPSQNKICGNQTSFGTYLPDPKLCNFNSRGEQMGFPCISKPAEATKYCLYECRYIPAHIQTPSPKGLSYWYYLKQTLCDQCQCPKFHDQCTKQDAQQEKQKKVLCPDGQIF